MKRNHAPYAYEIARALSNKYHDFHHFNKKNPLDELLLILCSVKRSERVYLKAFRSLKRAFPKFVDLYNAPTDLITNEVLWGGLQNKKASTVKAIMETIVDRFGRPSLSKLNHMKDEECEEFLLSLPGVGKKVARCVMLYSLDRKVFPVDTHCWRIAQRLYWVEPTVPGSKCSSTDMDCLQEKIPLELRFSLHVNMVSHGRKICSSRNPKCNLCPISKYCAI